MPVDQEVSFEDEPLILVDKDDAIVGYETKGRCHDGEGLLHRAFSIFLFDAQGRTLLQQRSRHKRLWPLYWSNTCCSHPRRGESLEVATARRLGQELGLESELHYLYEFTYAASFADLGSERELCHVLAGGLVGTPQPNANEVAAWRLVSPKDLDAEIQAAPDSFTPWFKMEWRELRREHLARIGEWLLLRRG